MAGSRQGPQTPGSGWGQGPRSPSPSFIGHKLRVARTFRGLDHADLGKRLGASRTLVGQLEADTREPAPELLRRLAAELGFAAAFFRTPFPGEPRDEECHAPGKRRRRALAHATLLAELVAWLDGRVHFPEQNLPEDADGAEPGAIEDTAAACRRLWNLAPDLPIPNLTRVVERAGVVVARARGADAGAHLGRRLLVVLDAQPADAGRFALARLAGHVVLHRGADAGSASLAVEAERFAVALLLPRDGLLRELPRAPSLDWEALGRLAERWKVSLATLARRAAELPIANASRYREATEHLTARECAARAPLPEADDEAPEVLALALERLARGCRIDPLEVARRLGWSPRIFGEVTGLDVGAGRGDNVVSLAAWKARRSCAAPATSGAAPQTHGQIELDFGRER